MRKKTKRWETSPPWQLLNHWQRELESFVRNINDIRGINGGQYYIGCAYSFRFTLKSSSCRLYLTTYPGRQNLVIVSSLHKTSSKAFVTKRLPHPQFFNRHHGEVAHVISTKKNFFNSLMFIDSYARSIISRVIQLSNQLVNLGPGVWNRALCLEYKVA